MFRIAFVSTLAMTLALGASTVAADLPEPRPVEASTKPLAAADAVLRKMVPADAYAYARIPSLWGALGAPKGSIYKDAVGSAPYVDAVNAIREGFGADVLPEVPEEARALVGLIGVHLRSPIEAVVLPPVAPGLPIPSLLLSAELSFADAPAFGQALQEIVKLDPRMHLVSPIDAQGSGVLMVGDAPMTLFFSGDDSRLYAQVGVQPDPAGLKAAIDALEPNPDHPMLAVEDELDSSGQGLYVWVDPKKVLELMQVMGQVREAAMLTSYGVGAMDAVALGLGSSGGALRLKLVAKMPQVGLRAFTPVMRYELGLEAAGEPSMVFVLGMPGSADLASIEQAVLPTLSPDDAEEYAKAKQVVQDKLGLTVEELLDIFGQELVAIFDEAGQYAGVRIAKPEAFDGLIQRLIAEFGFQRSERGIAGKTFTYLRVPSVVELVGEDTLSKGEPVEPLMKRYLSMPTSHIYYVREGDYLLLASAPQSLIDREYIEARTPIGQWLQKEQRMSPNGAVLLASLRNAGLPAFLYELNLQVLVALGDLSGRPVNLFDFPTARELDLPRDGAYSVRLASTEDELSLEFAFENNPIEFIMMGSGYTGVAVIGIMAAVAIPAYQDYTVRAKVAGTKALSAPVRTEIDIFVSEQGRLPDPSEVAGFTSVLASDQVEVVLGETDITVAVTVDAPSLVYDDVLRFVGTMGDGGSFEWQCDSDIEDKYLPDDCK